MDAEDPKSEIEKELRQLEDALTDLRQTAAELRAQLADGPMDAVDKTATITAAEEQEALAEDLELRREELRHRLGLD